MAKEKISGSRSNPGLLSTFSCHVFLVFFNLEECLFVCHDLDISENTRNFFFRKSLSLNLFGISSWLDSDGTFWAGKPEKWCCVPLSASHWEAHDVRYTHGEVSLMVMSTLIIWSAWYRPDFSTVKLLFLLWYLINILWGDILRLRKYLISHQDITH